MLDIDCLFLYSKPKMGGQLA